MSNRSNRAEMVKMVEDEVKRYSASISASDGTLSLSGFRSPGGPTSYRSKGALIAIQDPLEWTCAELARIVPSRDLADACKHVRSNANLQALVFSHLLESKRQVEVENIQRAAKIESLVVYGLVTGVLRRSSPLGDVGSHSAQSSRRLRRLPSVRESAAEDGLATSAEEDALNRHALAAQRRARRHARVYAASPRVDEMIREESDSAANNMRRSVDSATSMGSIAPFISDDEDDETPDTSLTTQTTRSGSTASGSGSGQKTVHASQPQVSAPAQAHVRSRHRDSVVVAVGRLEGLTIHRHMSVRSEADLLAHPQTQTSRPQERQQLEDGGQHGPGCLCCF